MPDLDLVVFTYESEDAAASALGQIVTAKKDNTQIPLVAVTDAAVAHKNDKGKVKIRQTLESAVKGTSVAGGGLWGMLIGLLLGGPLLGALIGMGIRALGNTGLDLGIDNTFISTVSDALAPGQSALFLLTSNTDPADINRALGDHGGTLYHTSLSAEASAALTDLAGDETIAQALSADQD